MAGKRKFAEVRDGSNQSPSEQPERPTKRQRTKKTPADKNGRSPATTFPKFLCLPAEIRQIIIQEAVKSPKNISWNHHKDEGLKVRKYGQSSLRQLHANDYATQNRSPLAIAFTSRLMYQEAAPLYYSLNTFQTNINYSTQFFPPRDPPRDLACKCPDNGSDYAPHLAIGPANTGTTS